MGRYTNYMPEDNNNKIPIELYRWQYGIRIKATDFKSGTITLQAQDYRNTIVSMQSNSSGISSIELYLEYPANFYEGQFLGYDESYAKKVGPSDIGIYHITSDGDEIPLWFNRNFPFKRMKMYNLEFSLSDAMTNGGIAPDVVEAADESMEEVEWNF